MIFAYFSNALGCYGAAFSDDGTLLSLEEYEPDPSLGGDGCVRGAVYTPGMGVVPPEVIRQAVRNNRGGKLGTLRLVNAKPIQVKRKMGGYMPVPVIDTAAIIADYQIAHQQRATRGGFENDVGATPTPAATTQTTSLGFFSKNAGTIGQVLAAATLAMTVALFVKWPFGKKAKAE